MSQKFNQDQIDGLASSLSRDFRRVLPVSTSHTANLESPGDACAWTTTGGESSGTGVSHSNTSRLNVTDAGVYLVQGSVCAYSTNSEDFVLTLCKNGSGTVVQKVAMAEFPSYDTKTLEFSLVTTLAASDYLELYGFYGEENWNQYTDAGFFQVTKIG